ncbi:MAG: hypothetical protein QE271_04020 [Bacteriovoracaceae bacterium]|nr:hypothetical protein [Bacteriovoracaceae bacterium]
MHLKILISILLNLLPIICLAECDWFITQPDVASETVKQELPKKGKNYLIRLIYESSFRSVVFNGLVERDNEILAEFIDTMPNGDKIRRQVHQNEIAEWRRTETTIVKASNLLFKILEWPMEQIISATTFSKLLFKPYFLLAKNEEAVKVVGDLLSSKASAKLIADRLKNFDSYMIDLGFNRPEVTRILLGRNSILPSLIGPFSMSWSTLNLWTGRSAQPVIAINPILWRTQSLTDEGALYHERTHSILHRSYKKVSFINRFLAFQEAFADFFAAHFTNDPVIGMDAMQSGKSIRNIGNGNQDNYGRGNSQNIFLDVKKDSYHNDSMVPSNIMWKLRNLIGISSIDDHIKSLIDNLNKYYTSYENILSREGKKTDDKAQLFLYNVEYFLAVIFMSSSNWSSKVQVEKLIREVANDLKLPSNRLDLIASSLTISDRESFAYEAPEDTFMINAYIAISTVAGVIIEASVISYLYNELSVFF